MVLEALVFPFTHLRKDFLSLALTFFDRIKVLSTTEEGPPEEIRDLVASQKVEVIVPAPLGDRLEDFKKTIAALENWALMMGRSGDLEVFKGLSREMIEESVGSIKAALKGEEPPEAEKNRLLEAQIFLTLAENLDRRLEDLEAEYHHLKKKAQDLTQMIVGPEGPEGFERWIIEPVEVPERAYLLRERLSSFVNLWIKAKDESQLLLSDQSEVMEILEIACERERLALPRLLYRRPLGEGKPARLKEEEMVLASLLEASVIDEDALIRAEKALKDLFPQREKGAHLVLYGFSQVEPRRLLAAATGLESPSTSGPKGTLVAILEYL
ncbi:hypothetical protein G4V39_08480 [Thermosulfuriphilus ammonigenes]|uniref:Uncharacterized protein n=1 Tax=Thermosulfuriphilus ammonigenes TaxID=1936021 RepID=A0A6G7PY19_9BACT|nr:hypothetical protein [Thermosulfuriphilus ammonigenes]MBA2849592.1 hypothetical protein [Thermosulfuriphilus ammonigenes]QIJ72303.1 hypothetical protein G4V39_08480 [Thermosulfuriphilus ammonigenes]